MKAGKLDKRIELQRFTATQDEYGEEAPKAWGTLGTVSAAIFYGKGDERREAGREEGSQVANFQVRVGVLTRSIKISDRIVFAGDNWDVVGVSPMGRAGVEFTAKRAL